MLVRHLIKSPSSLPPIINGSLTSIPARLPALRRLPGSITLKIDHSLIDRILINQTAARMLRGIVALAAALRLHSVAEGVESREARFLFAPPGSIAAKAGFGVRLCPERERHGYWSRVASLRNEVVPAEKNLKGF